MRLFNSNTGSICLFLSLSAGAVQAQDARSFDPARHFPAGAMIWARANLDGLGESLSETPLGKVVTDPRIAAALGRLSNALGEWVARQMPGFGLFELCESLRTEIGVSVMPVTSDGPPPVAVSLRLGENADSARNVIAFLDRTFRDQGMPPVARKLSVGERSIEMTGWVVANIDAELFQIFRAELGDSMVFAFGKLDGVEFMDVIARRFVSDDDGGAGEHGAIGALAKSCDADGTSAFLGVDVGRINTMLAALGAGFDPDSDAELVVSRVLTCLGLRGVGGVGFTVDKDLKVRLRVDFSDGPRGVLGRILEAAAPPSGVKAALARMPIETSACFSKSVDLGKLVNGVLADVRGSFDESQLVDFEQALILVQSMFGLSIEEDLASIGEASFHLFSVTPPAGALFPDSLVLMTRRDFAPYRRLLSKLARGPENLVARKLGGRTAVSAPIELVPAGASALGQFAFSVTWAEIDDAWVVVGCGPRGVRRYLEYYVKGPRLTEDAAFVAAIERVTDGALGGAQRGGNLVAWLVNSVSSLANVAGPMYDRFLRRYGLQPELLPLGEDFANRDAIYTTTFRVTENSADLSCAVGDSAVGAVLVGSVIAGFLVPMLTTSRERASEIACQNNLREIAKLGLVYADAGNRFFPYSPEGSIASIQQLVDFCSKGAFPVAPELFVCPAGTQYLAPTDPKGHFKLDESTCSYEWAPIRLAPTDSGMLAWDREPHHGGRRNVVYTDVSVRRLTEAEFQRELAKFPKNENEEEN